MCTAFVRRFVFNLPLDKIFTTRDCLKFGLRRAVDSSLFRLVEEGIIIRLARGVFVRDGSDLRAIGAWEVAQAKARAFGKEIARHGAKIAMELGLIPQARTLIKFYVSGGHSSSFRFGNAVIYFMGVSAKRMGIAYSKAGKAVRALWHLGRRNITPHLLEAAKVGLRRTDKDELRESIRWMPAWLADRIVTRSIPWGAI
jgi:hypothetical protein